MTLHEFAPRRIAALLCALALTMSLIPGAAFAETADLGFRRGGAPSSGEGARPACQSSVSWPEIESFPAREANEHKGNQR